VSINRNKLKFNGWGWNGQHYDFGNHKDTFLNYLEQSLDTKIPKTLQLAKAFSEINLPKSRLSKTDLSQLEELLPNDGLTTDDYQRLYHSYGKSLPDILRFRNGDVSNPPDAVLYPRSEEQVQKVLALAAKEKWAVVPFGGGSSVVGGVETIDPDGRPVLTLDTTFMNRMLNLDIESRSATFEAGIYGPDLEKCLEPYGLSLGHYPQSFEFSTLGGWVAARSSGQQSNHYGDITDMLISGNLVSPEGVLSSWNGPYSAGGPDTNHLVAGSEGTLGVITQSTVQVHPIPESHAINVVLFPDFETGTAALRDILGEGLKMSYLRLSDEDETATYLSMGGNHWYQDLGLGALSIVGYGRNRCIMLVGTEGAPKKVEHDIACALKICKKQKGLNLGRSASKNWHRDRFLHPYMRDDLLDYGIATETHETAVSWSKLSTVRQKAKQAVRQTVAEQGNKCIVMSHLSHSYTSGTCIYFIFMYPLNQADPIGQWKPIKQAICESISKVDGAVSHHHGVGLDHKAWLTQEKGVLALDAIRSVKNRLDPAGIMNPGKLLP